MIRGVLFDIDDTLIDLAAAQAATFHETMADQAELSGVELDLDRVDEATEHFTADVGGHYDRYVAGELDFVGQRLARVQDALQILGIDAPPSAELWSEGYEQRVRARWRLFDDVAPLLAWLDEQQLPYGAVSNNVEVYQRGKLAEVGLGWAVVVGIDTAGAPKPDPAPFLAACESLRCSPHEVLMVGDNPVADGAGARDAGLVSVVLDRRAHAADPASSLAENATVSHDQVGSVSVPEGVPVIDTLAAVRHFVIDPEPRV